MADLIPLVPYDRSRAVCDWVCPRKRYLNYEAGGTGLVPEREAVELFTGSILHDSLAAIARGDRIDSVADEAAAAIFDYHHQRPEQKVYAYEQSSLIKGLLLGFAKHCWPRLLDRFPKILAIEQEMSYEHDGLLFLCKPDLVLADKEGHVVYIEYKSTSSNSPEWISSWDTAIQLHATCRAIHQALGVEVQQVIVQGLYKGYEAYGKQNSPLCYAYHREAEPPFKAEQWLYEYKGGFKKFPLWERPGGVAAWVDGMPEPLLAEQFPQTPPIFVNEDMVDTFFRQRTAREKEIELARGIIAHMQDDPEAIRNILDVAFPQRFDQCTPSFRNAKPCAYKKVCYGEVIDPLREGFKPRTPHHAIEAAQNESLEESE